MENIASTIRQLIASGDLEEAEHSLAGALRQNPDSPELLNLQAELSLKLGADLWEKGEIDRALDYLTRAMELNPNDRDIVLKCGEVLTSLEQADSARTIYASYLQKNPEDEEIAKFLADVEQPAHKSSESDPEDKKTKIKVSAIVSTYNSERFMRGCLEDLVNQTLYQKGKLEIVVVDSGSQQDERSIVQEFQGRYHNITYIRSEERETVYAAWNRGIKASQGEYITNANTDDRHRQDALEYMASLLDRNPHIGLVYPDVIITATENETFEHHTPVGAYRWLEYVKEFLALECFIGPQPMWRKSLHDKYGYFDESFTSSGDWEFWLRIAEGTEMLHIPEFLGLYLYSPQSAEHRDHSKRVIEDKQVVQKYVPKYLSRIGDIERGLAAVREFTRKSGNPGSFASLETSLNDLKSRLLPKSPYQTLHSGRDISGTAVMRDLSGETAKGVFLKEDINAQFPGQKKGYFSLILLVSDRTNDLIHCINAMLKHIPFPHEIIAVPQDSNRFERESIRKLFDGNLCRFVSSPGVLNYPEAVNKGIAEARGEYIVIMNDDVIVTQGWLSGMMEHLKSAADIGIVAPMTVNVDGPQGILRAESAEQRAQSRERRAGDETHQDTSRLFETDEQLNQFAKAFRERNRHRRIEAVNLNGFCMLFKRELVKKIGFMDERLEVSDFTDNDYCLRAAIEGHRNIIAGDVFLQTHRYRTLAGSSGTFGTELARISRLFFQKWTLNTNTPLGTKVSILNILSTARQMMQKQQKNEALQVVSDIRKLTFDDTKTYFALSQIFMQNGQFSDAIEILENMPDTMQEDAQRFALMGYCAFSLHEIEKAAEYAEKALSLNSSSAKACNLKGLLAAHRGDRGEAEEYYRKAIEYDAGWGQPYMNLGVLKWDAGNREEAFTLFERAFILSPEDENIIKKYHDAAVVLNRLKHAEDFFEDALNLYPSHKNLRSAFADILVKQEKHHKAMNILEDTLLHCGVDDDAISLALKVRDKIGPKEIGREQIEIEKKGKVTEKTATEGSLLIAHSTDKGDAEETVEKKVSPPLRGGDKGEGVTNFENYPRPTPPPSMGRELLKPTISLCMIVKNEENNIAKCLHTNKPVINEIIVVDTGSTDRTKDIARAFGAKVFDFPWKNDFSAARNLSLSKATGDWILVLDADEVISPKDHQKLKGLIHPSSDVAYSFVTRNYISTVCLDWIQNDGAYIEEEAGSGWILSEKVRLFPNGQRIRFSNPVHELVEPSLPQAGIHVETIDIPVHHYGHLDRSFLASKHRRYYDLGKIKLDQLSGKNPRALLEIATQATNLGRYEEALEYWKRLTDEINPLSDRGFIGLGTVYCDLGRYPEAVSVMKKALELMPSSRDVLTFYAICEACAGNIGEAITALEEFSGREPLHPVATALLAAAYFCSNRKRKGFSLAKRLYNTYMDIARFFTGFATQLVKAQQYDYAESLLNAAIEGNFVPVEAYTLLAEAREKGKKGKESPSLIAHRAHEDKAEVEKKAKDKVEAEAHDKKKVEPQHTPRTLQTQVAQQTKEMQTMQKPAISLCMIARNEEDTIGRCLSSVKGLVDEIIVADTGSTDRTKKIARRLGAKVYDFKWTDNFSDARNFSISKAKGNWILILDADEVISPQDQEKLRELVTPPHPPLDKGGRGGVSAYSFTTRNYVGDRNIVNWMQNDRYYEEEAGTGWFPGEKVRLFPNISGIGFESPVHERIEPSLARRGIAIERCDIPVHHYGTLDREKQTAKTEHYFLLAKKKLAEQETPDITALHEIGVQAGQLGRYEEALEYLKEAVTAQPDFAKGYLSMGNSYYNLGRHSEALAHYEKALTLDPHMKDAVIQSALCRLYTGNPDPAVTGLETLVEKDTANTKALAVLATVYLATDRKSEGIRIIEQLKHLRFDYADILYPVAKTMLSAGNVNHAINLLDAARGDVISPEASENLLVSAHMMKKLSEANAKVSVMIIASENPLKTSRCIESVRRHTVEPHDIVVIPMEPSASSLAPPDSRQAGPPLKGGEERSSTSLEEGEEVNMPGSEAISSHPLSNLNAQSSSPPLSLPDSIGQSSQKECISDSSRKMTEDDPIPEQDKLTYAQAVNKGLQELSGDYFVVLTDDIIVTDGWLTGMLECVMSAPIMGLIGPMMTNVEGPQGLHRGESGEVRAESTEFDSREEFEQYSSRFRKRNRHRRIRARGLNGNCVLIRKGIIDNIGLFDPQFSTAEYAIEDFCLRSALEGFRNHIAGDVCVSCEDKKSVSSPEKARERILAHNKSLSSDRRLFVDKWSVVDVKSPEAGKLFALNACTLAEDLVHKGDMHNALIALLEGLKNAPDNQEMYDAVINLLHSSGNYKDAFDMLEKMPDELKTRAEWFEQAGICKEGLGFYEDARRYADQAIALSDNAAKAWNLKGIIAYKTGNFDDAWNFFSRALECDPVLGEAYANLGAIEWSKGKHREAFDFFTKAFILSPADEHILTNFQAVSVSLGELRKAEAFLKDAASGYPLHRKLQFALVDILLQEKKYAEAMEAFENALIAFGIDDDTLALALGIRDKTGPKEIRESSWFIADSPKGETEDKGEAEAQDKKKMETQQTQRTLQTQETQMTISLCMIVKNEEQYIARCLHRIAPLVDEMIVVDTGSTDRTKDIAKAFGAKVYDFAWTGDFSEARNYSLSKATGDWILVMDADEVVAPFDQDVLKKMLKKQSIRSASFTIISRNYTLQISAIGWKANDGSYFMEEAGTGWFPSAKSRIFPNNPLIRFENPVHEFVELSLLKLGIPNYEIEIPVHHYGKLHGEKVMSKGEDYYIIGKMKLAQRGENDPTALYELAIQASELQKFDEALHFWTKLYELRPDVSEPFFGAANSSYRLGKFEEAFALLEKALEIDNYAPKQRELGVLHASCALRLGKAETSIPILESLLKEDPEFPMGMLMLALLYCATEQRKAGKRYFERMVQMRVSFLEFTVDLLRFLLDAGRYNYVLPILETVIQVERSEQYIAMLSECQKMMEEQEKSPPLRVEGDTTSS